jgi:hypothetical protein
MLSLVKLAGTDERYYLEQAQGRGDRVVSMASGAEDYFLFGIGDGATQQAVLRAQDRAVAAALAHLEQHACRTRLGKGGAEVVNGAGFVGAAFRHRTSGAGDPQVHTHVLIGNATRRPDGQMGNA